MSVSVSVLTFERVYLQGIDIIFEFTEVVTTIRLRVTKSVSQSSCKTFYFFMSIPYSLENGVFSCLFGSSWVFWGLLESSRYMQLTNEVLV